MEISCCRPGGALGRLHRHAFRLILDLRDSNWHDNQLVTPKKRRVLISQKRRLTPQIKREFKRHAAIEPVIGHLKEHHRMGRNYLAHASGDAINAVLAAAGYNFRRLLAWLRLLLLRILIALGLAAQQIGLRNRVLHGRRSIRLTFLSSASPDATMPNIPSWSWPSIPSSQSM